MRSVNVDIFLSAKCNEQNMRTKSVLLILFLLCWSTIALCIAYYGWSITWETLFIPSGSQPFADMRSIQGALFSVSTGHNPQVDNPGDPWGRVMNYPSVWIDIAKFLGFENETNFMLFVSGCMLGYLYSCYTLLQKFPSVYMLLAMLSGACLLAVERGNNDLVVFSLIVAASHIRLDWVRSFIVLSAIILKIYPIFSIYGFFQKNIKVLAVTAMLAAIYMMVNYDEMLLIKSGNTASGYFTYGIHLDAILTVGLLSILILLIILLIKSGIADGLLINKCSEYERELFIIGGSIFVSTFVLAENWDYRLVFLLLCLPYIQSLKNKFILHITSVCVLFSMNVLLMDISGPFMDILGPFIDTTIEMSKFYLFVAISIAVTHELSSRTFISATRNGIPQ